VLLSGYATPEAMRRMGEARLSRWLQQRRVRGYSDVAARAVAAAQTQQTVLPGQDVAASIVAELANSVLVQHERLKVLEQQIQDAFAQHPQADVIESIPGFGPVLGASLLVAAGDLAAYPTAGHLAAAAGLVPVPNDSGRRAGNLHKPRRYSRPLRHALYVSAQTSMMRAGPNRDYSLKSVTKGVPTARRSSRWPADASTSYGRCCATTAPGLPPHRRGLKLLDNTIEIRSARAPRGHRPQPGARRR